jgi:RNA polymerase sigma-70 factor (ECF subfamily)
MPDHGDVTAPLHRLKQGDNAAEPELVKHVYGELRKLAAHYMRRERPDHTLQPTALAHEAFVRLVDQTAVNWQSRAHFFAIAGRAMRNILIDHARRVHAEKRAGGWQRVDLDAILVYTEDKSSTLLALDEALERLATWDARQGRIVELRFFGGLSIEETAEVLGVSSRTVKRDWMMARAWLHREITQESV